jgi:hypothetical protein
MGRKKTINNPLILSLASIGISFVFIISLIVAKANKILTYSYCVNNGFREDECFTEVFLMPLMAFALSISILLTCKAVKYRKLHVDAIPVISISALLVLIDLIVLACMFVSYE